ncbi:MinD/ParA family protein [Pseudonocardia sp. Ae717_Ps2]|uniref:MinD/ParA family ATP-binding protein n=1 Tax=Pseudonocardia sp. Ae717_Ps2 TaxID=1885573 RepID=UPI001E460EEC|nr:MinD/ParA family protein [Pseudonocardia sp. Ae717_Ps2]
MPEQTSEKTSAGETPSWLADGAAAWAAPGSPGTAESPVPVVPVERPVPDESPEQLLAAGSGAGLQPGRPVAAPQAPPVSAALWSVDAADAPGVAAGLDAGFSDGGVFADVVRPKLAAPTHGWRAAVHALSGGRWNPGLSATELRLKDQVRRVTTPLSGPFSVAVGSIKGGVGKTTVTSLLGLAMAEYRGDRVIAIDANPDAGTLGDRLVGEVQAGRRTVRDLLHDLDRVQSSTQLSGYTHLAGRLRVLTSEQEPALSEMFSARDYEAVLRLLSVYHELLLTDCGTGLVHSAMQGTLRHADALVVVGAPTKDGASRAARTLQWLATHQDSSGRFPYRDLVADAVVVLSCDRASRYVDDSVIVDYFASRVRAVVELPADPHLATGDIIDLAALAPATRDAVLELAAVVADGFQARTSGLAAHGFRDTHPRDIHTGHADPQAGLR